VVLGGDGADWIRGGRPPDGRGLFQLDRFHRARACRRRWKADGAAAYTAARTGDAPTLQARLAAAWEAATTDRRRAKRRELEHYLTANADGLVDWGRRLALPAPAAGGLGAMEANSDQPYARRLQRRGMSWSRRGLQALAKVLQLRENGELVAAAQALPTAPPVPAGRAASAASTAPRAGRGNTPPFQARFAPRWGPHAARPWGRALSRWLT
jgi:hypothetical protein